MFRKKRINNNTIIIISALFILGACSTAKDAYWYMFSSEYANSVYAKLPSYTIVLKGNVNDWDYRDYSLSIDAPMLFFLGSQVPYIELHLAEIQRNQYVSTTYFSHRTDDREELGFWYTTNDTLVLIPRVVMFLNSNRVIVDNDELVRLQKEFRIEENTITDITKYEIDDFLKSVGYTPEYDGEYRVTQYDIVENADLLRKSMTSLKLNHTKNPYLNDLIQVSYRPTGPLRFRYMFKPEDWVVTNTSSEDQWLWWSGQDISKYSNRKKVRTYFFKTDYHIYPSQKIYTALTENTMCADTLKQRFFFKRLKPGGHFVLQFHEFPHEAMEDFISRHLVVMDSSSFFNSYKPAQILRGNQCSYQYDTVIVSIDYRDGWLNKRRGIDINR